MMRALPLLIAFLVVAAPALTDEGELSERVDILLDQLTAGGLSMSRSATIALQSLGEEGRKILILRLRSQEPLERQRAVLGLGALGRRENAAPVLELAEDRDPRVRAAAMKTLGRLGSGGTFRAILGGLDDPTGDVRAEAVLALAHLGHTQALKPVLRLSLDPDPDVRAAVAFAVGRFGDRSAGSLLCLKALARDESGTVRRKAAVSLGEVGSRYVVEDLLFGLSDEDTWVRSASARSLGKILRGDGLTPAAAPVPAPELETALRGLRGLLADESGFVRASAAEALGEMGDRGSIASLAGLLDDESPSGIYLFTSMRELSVAEVAASSLGRITGDNLGYERELPVDKRERALGRWRKWREKTVEGSGLKDESRN